LPRTLVIRTDSDLIPSVRGVAAENSAGRWGI
jgi:hypothetical protein